MSTENTLTVLVGTLKFSEKRILGPGDPLTAADVKKLGDQKADLVTRGIIGEAPVNRARGTGALETRILELETELAALTESKADAAKLIATTKERDDALAQIADLKKKLEKAEADAKAAAELAEKAAGAS